MKRRMTVIVKSFGDEPVRLWLFSSGGTRSIVGNQKKTATLCLPNESLFRFQRNTFRQLRKAFDQGRLVDLADLWRKAEAA